jgi:hypothetical protein
VVRVPKRPDGDVVRDNIARQRICAIFKALLGSEYVLSEVGFLAIYFDFIYFFCSKSRRNC